MALAFNDPRAAIAWLKEQGQMHNCPISEMDIQNEWGENVPHIDLDAALITLCEKDAEKLPGPMLVDLVRDGVVKFRDRKCMVTHIRCLQIALFLDEGRLVPQFKAGLEPLVAMLMQHIEPIRIDTIAGALNWVRRHGPVPLEAPQGEAMPLQFDLSAMLRNLFGAEVSVQEKVGLDNVVALALNKRLSFFMPDGEEAYHAKGTAFDCIAIIVKFVKCPLVEHFKAELTIDLRSALLSSFR